MDHFQGKKVISTHVNAQGRTIAVLEDGETWEHRHYDQNHLGQPDDFYTWCRIGAIPGTPAYEADMKLRGFR